MPPIVLIALAVVLWLQLRSKPGTRTRAASVPKPEYGDCSKEGIKLMNWDAWMNTAPAIIEAALNEGEKNPEVIVNNTLRRLFPKKVWPPKPGDPRFSQWTRMVEAVGRALESPFNPNLHVVPGSDGA